MTEIETLQRARMYINKLANGINPLDDMPVSDDDVINNVRISRCFYYVSEVLDKVIAKGGLEKKQKLKKVPFSLTYEQAEEFEYSDSPITVTEMISRINGLIDIETMKHLKVTSITEWLVEIDLLCVVELAEGKRVKRPTEKGFQIGIIEEKRNGMYGEYTVILYDKSAQHFIMENIEAAIARNERKRKHGNEGNNE